MLNIRLIQCHYALAAILTHARPPLRTFETRIVVCFYELVRLGRRRVFFVVTRLGVRRVSTRHIAWRRRTRIVDAALRHGAARRLASLVLVVDELDVLENILGHDAVGCGGCSGGRRLGRANVFRRLERRRRRWRRLRWRRISALGGVSG